MSLKCLRRYQKDAGVHTGMPAIKARHKITYPPTVERGQNDGHIALQY